MYDSIARIAFATNEETFISRQLACGLSRFANRSHGFVVREFVIPVEAREFPHSFGVWSPDAVVCFIAAERVELLEALAEFGLPAVNMSRSQPLANRGVVLGNANEFYDAVHEHFREIGRCEVHQFVLGGSTGELGVEAHYRRYCESHQIPFSSFAVADPEKFDIDRLSELDESMANWLRGLAHPVGVFSQNTFAGGYLCRACAMLGIDVPGEIAVIGTDGFDVATASRPSVTSIYIPAIDIGYEAGKLIAAMLAGQPAPADLVLVNGVRLIVRDSTRPIRHNDCDIDAGMKFIQSHSCEGIRVNDVVSHTQGVSRMTFHKQFVETLGITPGEAIKQRKLREARQLLANTLLSTGSIARMCGFGDYMHFYRFFREAEGISPRNYRQSMRSI